tara:strand:- start:90 stop:434 length:345 start_codon:yes stop_codon:yes gene_type:complete
MKFPKTNKKIKNKKKPTGIKGIKLETDINKLLNILQKKFGKSKGGIVSILQLAAGGFPKKTGMINGPGTGTSDDIPAMLSNGEFVFTAKAVKNAGGAKPMYDMMNNLEKGSKLT